MNYEQARTEAREDVVAVLDGTEQERREQLARIAVWAVESGKGIARAAGEAPAGARSFRASETALNEDARERARVLADMLRQNRAAV